MPLPGIVCALGVAEYVVATWHPKLGRSESPVAGAVGCGVHRQGAREAGEVLPVSDVGGSWPYGWNRPVA